MWNVMKRTFLNWIFLYSVSIYLQFWISWRNRIHSTHIFYRNFPRLLKFSKLMWFDLRWKNHWVTHEVVPFSHLNFSGILKYGISRAIAKARLRWLARARLLRLKYAISLVSFPSAVFKASSSWPSSKMTWKSWMIFQWIIDHFENFSSHLLFIL